MFFPYYHLPRDRKNSVLWNTYLYVLIIPQVPYFVNPQNISATKYPPVTAGIS